MLFAELIQEAILSDQDNAPLGSEAGRLDKWWFQLRSLAPGKGNEQDTKFFGPIVSDDSGMFLNELRKNLGVKIVNVGETLDCPDCQWHGGSDPYMILTSYCGKHVD